MLPAKVRLWKKNENKWVFYSRVYFIPLDYTPASEEIQIIARMVQRGWIPYNADYKKISDTTLPVKYNWQEIDITKYEEKLKQLDPISNNCGKAFTRFANDYANKPRQKKDKHADDTVFIIPEEFKIIAATTALEKAVRDYKAGKFVPEFLLQDVFSYLSQ